MGILKREEAMKKAIVLVVGGGGREHAIVTALAGSPHVGQIFCVPGNAGIAKHAICVDVKLADLPKFALGYNVGLTVVGPEPPLFKGLADVFEEAGLRLVGPNAMAARLEVSKIFAAKFMERHGIPAPHSEAFGGVEVAADYIRRRNCPLVVKYDGPTGGKGVTVANSAFEAITEVKAIIAQNKFGPEARVIIQDKLAGQEASMFVLTDGEAIMVLPSACDYKRALDGDKGDNTGGMGSFSPSQNIADSPTLYNQIMSSIVRPTIEGMSYEGYPYKGFLYFRLMLTEQGPRVLEYNCRLGDPDTQVVLPRIQTDFYELCLAAATGRLGDIGLLEINSKATVGVVLASGGYPSKYKINLKIIGLDDAVLTGAYVYHTATKLESGQDGSYLTAGGRVLTVVGQGRDHAEARALAYEAVNCIHFQDMHYRRDIAARPLR